MCFNFEVSVASGLLSLLFIIYLINRNQPKGQSERSGDYLIATLLLCSSLMQFGEAYVWKIQIIQDLFFQF